MSDKLDVLVFGAGAVGSTVGGWLAQHHAAVHFLDRGPVAAALRDRGLTLYQQHQRDRAETVRVAVVESLADVPRPDVVLLAVKNYSLDGACGALRDRFGGGDDGPIVVGLQNGVENQTILPRYFARVVYGVVSYNAWIDEPAVVGYQKRGPLVLGTILNLLRPELALVSDLLGRGVETVVTDRLQDAAHSKMVINLTNSFTTLIGHGFREVSDPRLFQKLLSNLTYEGVRIVRAAGYRECQVGGMPSWSLMTAAATLPLFVTRGPFEKNVKKMVISSMAQDIIQRGGTDSELESINGYFLTLADRHGVRAPFNRAVYELCREHFKPGFTPLDVRDVWDRVRQHGG
jgi:2-dehydropantoate 2-reductase